MNLFVSAPRRPAGMTLTELLVSIALVLLVMGAILTCHFMGLRLFEWTKAKLGASDEARAAISKMVAEIRSARLVRIGSGDLASFTEVEFNTAQVGNAIQVYATTNTNHFIRYFWDQSDHRLKRTTNGSTYVAVVANAISNAMVFTSEDHTGAVLTNHQNNRVIGVTLQFYQLQYPTVPIGPGGLFDFYQLRTRITRRTLE